MTSGMRWPAAILVALLLAFLVLREALVAAYVSRDPAKAAMLWPSHPAVVLESGLAQIGDAAAAGRPADPMLVDRLIAASAHSPLAPEPFLVRGVQARVAGNEALAGRAFVAARERNPRLPAARYFLADHYLRTGQTRQGLAEIAALARLVPESLAGVAPYLAFYARAPDVAPQVKSMVRNNPELETVLLNTLSADARDARLALYLWSGRTDGNSKGWQEQLLGTLVSAGRFGEAGAAWSRFSGRVAGQLDPEFRTDRLAPFGWSLSSDASGLAEALGSGRLHVLYYGRDDKVLASQLLLLRPGRYSLSMNVRGASPTAASLALILRCLPSSAEAVTLGLRKSTSGGVLAQTFDVPSAGCGAQRIELKGTAPEFAERAEATISNLKLEGAGR